MSALLWEPSPERIEHANLTAFMRFVERDGLADQPEFLGKPEFRNKLDFPSLRAWSVAHPEQFWPALWSFGGIVASRRWDTVVADLDKMPGATWFGGARLNFAENVLRYRDDRPALVAWNEHGRQRSLTYAELYTGVARLAAAFRKFGVQPGDRVAGFLPNLPETIMAMLAATSIGAIWSSTSPDFGLQGVMDRFGQIEPKVLIAADGYFYNGKVFDSLERVAEITDRIPSIEQVLIVPYTRPNPPLGAIRNALRFDTCLETTSSAEIVFEQLPFDHPLYIMYSSGTTGVPKCIVHGAGGSLIQHLKELLLHSNLKREDRIFYFTTCGWMMWNWLVSSLAVGATLVLYDGSPFHPGPSILFDMAEQERVTVFGTSAKYLSALQKTDVDPRRTHDLSALQTILSTGSPLLGDSFDFVYEKIKTDVCLSSISGGTDILSCFALGNPIGPVYRGEIQTCGLGMNVLVYNDNGEPLVGEKGELVCATPFPSMPIGFWNDPTGEKYHAAYFDVYPNIWRHGDYVELTEHDGMIIYGRSDAVLNPGGVRIGTAEIYRQVEQLPEVLESIVVGQEWEGDVRVVLFVKLAAGTTLDEALRDKIRCHIRRNTTPRHVPRKVIAVPDIPRTISGKIVELAVRDVIHHRPIKNRDALANPAALAHFENLPELLND